MNGTVIDFPNASVTCNRCPWASSCLGRHAIAGHEDNRSLQCATPMKRGQYIVRQGDELEAVYILRSGSAKSYFGSSDGLEQLIAFHYPGDLLGFDAVASGSHQSSIVALETAALCRIPYSGKEASVSQDPRLWMEIMRAASQQLRDAHAHTLMMGQKSAMARFAGFLLDVSARLSARGCSRSEFNLSMARQDIANYLSLAVETISRLFGDLQGQGIIDVQRRYVLIRDMNQLQAIAEDRCAPARRATSA